jgi:hypothetical protein
VYRVICPECGVRIEKVPLQPGKAPFSMRFEDAVGQACESASARQVARRMGLPESTVRAIDLRYLERWDGQRRLPPLRQMGVDEIYRGKRGKFPTVVCNLEAAKTHRGGLCRHVGTIAVEHRVMGAAVQDRLPQVSHPMTRQ